MMRLKMVIGMQIDAAARPERWSIGRKDWFGKYELSGAQSYCGGWNKDTMDAHGNYTFDNGELTFLVSQSARPNQSCMFPYR